MQPSSLYKLVVPQIGWTVPWGSEGYEANGAPVVGPSERVVRLFTFDASLDQTLGNWYLFIKPIHRIKNSLRVKSEDSDDGV
jgi:hypothetical protein